MTNAQLERLFSTWYDNRPGMPPAAFESWKAGYDAASKNLTNGSVLSPEYIGSKLARKRTDEIVGG